MKRHADTHAVEIVGRRVFYIWGFVPEEYRINMAEELAPYVGSEVSGVKIEQFFEPLDIVASVLSLGFYVPRSYRITVYRRRWSDER